MVTREFELYRVKTICDGFERIVGHYIYRNDCFNNNI